MHLVPLYYDTVMKWIATNIRFPEDMYMELKFEAAKKRKSVAALVRERVEKEKSMTPKKIDVEAKMREVDKLAKANSKYMKGIDLTKTLIEMRYEQ